MNMTILSRMKKLYNEILFHLFFQGYRKTILSWYPLRHLDQILLIAISGHLETQREKKNQT